MATPSVKPSVTPPKSAAVAEKPEQLQLNIHGIPPKPNMADDLPPPDEKHVSETTRAELEAGRKAVTLREERLNAEFAAGKKAVAHLQSNSESGEK